MIKHNFDLTQKKLRFIALIVHNSSRRVDVVNQLKDEGFYVVDCPENGLSPIDIRDKFSYELKLAYEGHTSKFQIWVTYSPIILDLIDLTIPENIYVLPYHSDEVKQFLPSVGDVWRPGMAPSDEYMIGY